MSYIVVYLRADGSSGVEECADLDLAVVAAERLRNVDSVERPRIFKTEEVTYDFKPYYRVEVTTSEDAGADEWVGHSAVAPAAAATVPSVAPVAPVVEEPAAAPTEVVEPAAETIEAIVEAPADEQPPAPPVMPEADEVVAEAEDVPTKKGLFGDSVSEPAIETPEVSPLVEDVKDSVPPRRGLFGR